MPLTISGFELLIEGKQDEQQKHEKPLLNEVAVIKELRNEIKNEMYDIVTQQKVNYTMDGCWFKVFKPAVNAPAYIYAKVSETNADLFYQCAEDTHSIPTTFSSSNSITNYSSYS